MPIETIYPSQTSFQQAIELARLDPNGDVLNYMGEVLDEFPKNVQEAAGFQKFKEDTRDLAITVRKENETSSNALYAGDLAGLESGKQAILNDMISSVKDTLLLFHYAVEDNTTKIASGFQTIDGNFLPPTDDKAKVLTMLFHLWLKENNLVRIGDGVYIQNTNQLVNSEELKNLIKNEENGFARYLQNKQINNVGLFETEYVITAPKEAPITTKVELGVESSSPEEQAKGLSGKPGG